MSDQLPLGRILTGDAPTVLEQLPTASVDTVVTSPPYVALRDYGWPGQIGAEPSVDAWIADLRAVMAEVARVLKPSGTLWLNLGDSYSRHVRHGAPPKSRLLAPERLVLRLMADGWVVRNVVAWVKPNPMPSSVGDRLTCSWEPVYLLVRSPKYFFDLDAVRRPHRSRRAPSRTKVNRRRAPWAGPLAGDQSGLDGLHSSGLPGHPLGKNPGDVWRLTTAKGRDGHHASFPKALVELPITAGCPERVCRRCGQPWQRQSVNRQLGHLAVLGGLHPTCACRAAWAPGVVLDPFIGSGTTAVVAERLGRDWLGIELNPAYVARAEERIRASKAWPARSPSGQSKEEVA